MNLKMHNAPPATAGCKTTTSGHQYCIRFASLKQLDKIKKRSENKLIILDFYNDKCGPCKSIAPVYERLAAEYKDVVFLKVNGDKSRALSALFDFYYYPTFIFLKNGREVDSFTGPREDVLRSKIDQHKGE
ncbi:peptide-N4-(N-acetyl-beta- glucosaminyl)asparagine amidase [Clonorchis sinensis]|uniref:Peptide-N4-(N-acetyl-beta-glucosaminyl)asparagine amidase n=2 Tax=Clonorchis sinensis TaxID=79923 RepID=A0A8T1MAI5_CLOSI|nr:peptide-N4-(N-acetyl-beta- glucosaminyl)asparagine amidase [Clonorchis sinensis]GAA48179.1 peptide-N4-(N-acetyl-beta-glucosaminyl) asparagine amidase [Clonorchis sinensis]